jgi:RHS repeat-associated protein
MPTTLEQIQYGFDRDSRRTWKRRALAADEDDHYRYDALSQVTTAARGNLNLNLTAISGRPVSEQSWDYDPTGNWRGFDAAENGNPILDQHRVHDRGNRLTQIEDSPTMMVLDRAGRMRQVASDAEGDWNGKLDFTWDAWSRVTSVKSNGAMVGEYEYDGLTRRTTREVSGVTWHSYYSDAWRPLEERKNAETTAAIGYLWGARHRDDLVRRDRAVGGTSLNETRFVLMDYFSAAAIADEDGEVKERYAYTAFGVRRVLTPEFTLRTSSECAFEFGFQGQFLDTESGLYNYGYRNYSPHLGRWLSKDPIEERGGINLYGMIGNDPVNGVDHLGLLSNGKFIDWYFNRNGDTYDINAEGEITELKNVLTQELPDIYKKAWEKIKAYAPKPCGGKINPSVNSGQPFTERFSRRGNRETVDLEGELYWLGTSTLLWGLEGELTINCCNGTYSYEGKILFSFRDTVSDPLDFFNLVPDKWFTLEVPTGSPYKINANWDEEFPASGYFP